jgi:hypothetical protein
MIGVSNPDATDEQLQQLVLTALKTGNLYVWDGKSIYSSNMCPACSSP